MVVADSKQSLTITGNGDVLEPHDGVIGTVGARSACAKPCFLKYTDNLGLLFLVKGNLWGCLACE